MLSPGKAEGWNTGQIRPPPDWLGNANTIDLLFAWGGMERALAVGHGNFHMNRWKRRHDCLYRPPRFAHAAHAVWHHAGLVHRGAVRAGRPHRTHHFPSLRV